MTKVILVTNNFTISGISLKDSYYLLDEEVYARLENVENPEIVDTMPWWDVVGLVTKRKAHHYLKGKQ